MLHHAHVELSKKNPTFDQVGGSSELYITGQYRILQREVPIQEPFYLFGEYDLDSSSNVVLLQKILDATSEVLAELVFSVRRDDFDHFARYVWEWLLLQPYWVWEKSYGWSQQLKQGHGGEWLCSSPLANFWDPDYAIDYPTASICLIRSKYVCQKNPILSLELLNLVLNQQKYHLSVSELDVIWSIGTCALENQDNIRRFMFVDNWLEAVNIASEREDRVFLQFNTKWDISFSFSPLLLDCWQRLYGAIDWPALKQHFVFSEKTPTFLSFSEKAVAWMEAISVLKHTSKEKEFCAIVLSYWPELNKQMQDRTWVAFEDALRRYSVVQDVGDAAIPPTPNGTCPDAIEYRNALSILDRVSSKNISG